MFQIALRARRNLTAYDMRGTLLSFGVQSRVLQCVVPRSSNVWTKAANKMYLPPSEGAVAHRHRKSNIGMKLTGKNRVLGKNLSH